MKLARLIPILMLAAPAILNWTCAFSNQNEAPMSMCHGDEYTAHRAFAALGSQSGFRAAHTAPTLTPPAHGGVRVEFPVEGGAPGKGFLARSHFRTNKVLLLFHEWWGMNENIMNEAIIWSHAFDAYVLAVDLYDGQVAETREDAAKLMQSADPARMEAIIRGAAAYCGPQARLYTLGWCFGGTWSLQAALLLDDQVKGCVVYYGMPESDADKLAKLKAEVLFVHATQDKWITDEVVAAFEKKMTELGKKLTVKRYDADHAFANPSGQRYHEEAAQDARMETVKFLAELGN